MQDIDLNDPAYKGITKKELCNLKHFSLEEKEELSMRIFGESLYGPPPLEKQLDQRWQALLGEPLPRGKHYKASHQSLMAKIALNKRRNAYGSSPAADRPLTVSSFVDWVLRLYAPPPSYEALMSGVEGERNVVDHRKIIRKVKHEIPRWEHRGWKLIHDGVRGNFDQGFSIPTLTVGGVPLKGVPDLVFRERRTGRILIVELKVSSADLPQDGWPNLRAQLWAYSRIEKWATAPEVLLAGEVWAPRIDQPFRRGTYFCRGDDSTLNEQCAELFQEYGGCVTAIE